MKTFTDAAGRTWTIALTLGSALAVKGKLGIDLLAIEAGAVPLLSRLGSDELLLGEVICALLEGQFQSHQVDAPQVQASFDGQTLLAAQKAFYGELIDFFRSRGRADRAGAVAKQMALIESAVAAMEARIEALDVDRMIQEAMMAPGQASGASPDRSASTPGH